MQRVSQVQCAVQLHTISINSVAQALFQVISQVSITKAILIDMLCLAQGSV